MGAGAIKRAHVHFAVGVVLGVRAVAEERREGVLDALAGGAARFVAEPVARDQDGVGAHGLGQSSRASQGGHGVEFVLQDQDGLAQHGVPRTRVPLDGTNLPVPSREGVRSKLHPEQRALALRLSKGAVPILRSLRVAVVANVNGKLHAHAKVRRVRERTHLVHRGRLVRAFHQTVQSMRQAQPLSRSVQSVQDVGPNVGRGEDGEVVPRGHEEGGFHHSVQERTNALADLRGVRERTLQRPRLFARVGKPVKRLVRIDGGFGQQVRRGPRVQSRVQHRINDESTHAVGVHVGVCGPQCRAVRHAIVVDHGFVQRGPNQVHVPRHERRGQVLEVLAVVLFAPTHDSLETGSISCQRFLGRGRVEREVAKAGPLAQGRVSVLGAAGRTRQPHAPRVKAQDVVLSPEVGGQARRSHGSSMVARPAGVDQDCAQALGSVLDSISANGNVNRFVDRRMQVVQGDSQGSALEARVFRERARLPLKKFLLGPHNVDIGK
ncbi:hypothetical protein H257_03384 [Aphanomyces astaci]|uniref:Uncharacterized protein n=1 Tax=Aphanomyces astaci TaxID=112090 RepID=W4GWC3_APHAT|nr:hypothetical protein H257_03384 [Aphanomyces astaci]ETV84025.1 hypothetical protein H257_03384 [Aphanomyces astaci]|eukprot:XP_009825717.1 hypothetical protein H257_03384 [Aphanomyces astaci]